MKIKGFISVLVLCVLLSACENGSKISNNTNTSEEISDVNEGKEVTYLTNLYKCVIDNKTGEEKYGLLLNEPFVYNGENLSIGAGMYIKNEMIEDKDISVLCLVLLDGIPIPFSVEDNEQDIFQNVVLQNGVEKRIKLGLKPYGVSEEKKSLIFLGIPFVYKEKIEVYENDILYCVKEIVSDSGSLSIKNERPQYEYDYIDNISEIIQSVIMDTDTSNGQEQYIHNFIYSNNNQYFFTSDINEGKNETLLFCDGKLYSGFGGSAYFLWEGKNEYVNMEIDTSELSEGKHIMFAVTIENKDGFVTVNKSLNMEVNVHE